jgi:hypothetical protein
MECHNYATRGRKLFESLILNDSEKALNSSKVQANVPSTRFANLFSVKKFLLVLSCTEKQRRVCFGGVSLHRFGIVPGACTVPDDGGVTSMGQSLTQ